MARRLFPWLLPVLLALAFVVPMGSADGLHATIFERPADSGAVPIASTPFHGDDQATSWSQWTSDDDDRIVQVRAITAWASVTFSIPPRRASAAPRGAYPTAAAFPRGPPSA